MAAIDQTETTWLTLDLWHPNCWAIKATGKATGGVLAHSIYTSPKTDGNHTGKVKGLFTAFADDEAEVTALLDEIRDSELTGELSELRERFGRERDAPGNVVREFFVEYDPDDMVCPTLLEHGFVHNAPVRIENGREEWQVCFVNERSEIDDALDRVREEAGAEVRIDSITTSEAATTTTRNQRLDKLTAKQRDVFEHARQAGYYEWPRQCDTRELAADLDVSKTTLLEHLRKAEAKLLDP
ncbi:helix-turn-helix domain-containing protein [Haloarcula laminariae]|uniref:helix-turn-helix domain-containing protein n=1 Tax=Haloarcula laminariae TaxID=2961577 RepID=UPI0021C9EF24|nr:MULTISPECIES: helix-turn-helix domain-containing protein [Halomicroarcula]